MTVTVVPIRDEHIAGYHAAVDAVARERRFLAMTEAPPFAMAQGFVRGNIERGNPHVVALDGRGRMHSSEHLAQRLEHWRGQGRDLAFLIGGPEGHAPEVLQRADETWSLGPLTLPHMLVRLVLAEQVYRAAALLANHPYHRA